jgi:hypothetical protein
LQQQQQQRDSKNGTVTQAAAAAAAAAAERDGRVRAERTSAQWADASVFSSSSPAEGGAREDRFALLALPRSRTQSALLWDWQAMHEEGEGRGVSLGLC